MKRIIVWLILGVLLLIATVVVEAPLVSRLFVRRPNADATAIEPLAAPSRVGALGRIEPSSEVIDVGTPLEDRVLQLLVAEGQSVKAGDELAYLDSYEVKLAEKNEVAALLDEAKSRATTLRADGQAKIHAAEIRLKTIEQLDPLEINLQQSRLRIAEIVFKESETKFVRAKGLVGNNAFSAEEYDRRQVEYQSQQEMLNADRLKLSELEAKYRLGLELAAADVDEAKASMDQTLAAIPIASLEGKLALCEAQMQQRVIRAPLSGRVLKILTRPGERIGTEPILRLGNTDEMHAVAEVYETDISRVRVGQTATVTCPALERPIRGSVVEVGIMIYKNDVLNVDPTADADSRVVEVRIRLDEPKPVAALTNLQVDVLIDVGEAAE